jgi:hypothetical protein
MVYNGGSVCAVTDFCSIHLTLLVETFMSTDFNDSPRYGDDLNQAATFGEDAFRQRTAVNRSFFLPIILLAGLSSTVIVFAVNYVVNVYADINLFGFIVNFVFPVGAIIGGCVAGIGYCIAARVTQFRPAMRFLFFVFVLQFAVFFVARYTEYTIFVRELRDVQYREAKEFIQAAKQQSEEQNEKLDGNEIIVTDEMIRAAVDENTPSFITFYRVTVEETEWSSSRGNEKPFKFGIWGWGIELLTMFAFALCSVLPLVILSAMAYCKDCSLFMKERLRFTYPLRIPTEKIKKKDTVALEDFHSRDVLAMKDAIDKVVRIRDFLKSEQAEDNNAVLQFLTDIRDETLNETKSVKNVPNFLQVTFADCKNCGNFQITVQITANDVNTKTAIPATTMLTYSDKQLVVDNVDTFQEALNQTPLQTEQT